MAELWVSFPSTLPKDIIQTYIQLCTATKKTSSSSNRINHDFKIKFISLLLWSNYLYCFILVYSLTDLPLINKNLHMNLGHMMSITETGLSKEPIYWFRGKRAAVNPVHACPGPVIRPLLLLLEDWPVSVPIQFLTITNAVLGICPMNKLEISCDNQIQFPWATQARAEPVSWSRHTKPHICSKLQ